MSMWKCHNHGGHGFQSDCTESKRIGEIKAENGSLREAAQAVSDGHWHERSYREMRSLIRAMDKVLLQEKTK